MIMKRNVVFNEIFLTFKNSVAILSESVGTSKFSIRENRENQNVYRYVNLRHVDYDRPDHFFCKFRESLNGEGSVDENNCRIN